MGEMGDMVDRVNAPAIVASERFHTDRRDRRRSLLWSLMISASMICASCLRRRLRFAVLALAIEKDCAIRNESDPGSRARMRSTGRGGMMLAATLRSGVRGKINEASAISDSSNLNLIERVNDK